MNTILQKEIISHIFGLIGLHTGNSQSFQRQFIGLASEKFLSTQKLVIEMDDNRYDKRIWAAYGLVNNIKIKLLLTDISDDTLEYLLLIKLDDLDASALYFAPTLEDNGSIYFSFNNNNWGLADILMQSKLLVGVESLSSLFIDWKKLEDIEDLYKLLPDILNTIFPNE